MEYEPDQFFSLVEKVEAQGGAHLDTLCEVRKYTFTGKLVKPIVKPGCGNPTLFTVPYKHRDTKGVERDHAVKVCAVEDNMGLWPRFSK